MPILGGRFDGQRLRGRLLPSGADLQLLRADGNDPGTCYARSVLQVRTAPGPHVWVMRRVLVGTLDSLRPDRAAVRVTVYVLN